MNILDPASQLPVADLQELVKMATILRDAIAVSHSTYFVI